MHDHRSFSFRIAGWHAWAPGLETRDQWCEWARGEHHIATSGIPRVECLPPLMRRRCSLLMKMAIEVAWGATTGEDRSTCPVVFASRYGEIETTLRLLADIVRGEEISPTGFTSSVHNAGLGLFSIIADNRHGMTAVAGGEASFGYGFLETLRMLDRSRSGRALYLFAEEPLPETCARYADTPQLPMAIGVVVTKNQGAESHFQCVANERDSREASTMSLEFVRWLLGDLEVFERTVGGRTWRWIRGET